jgi:multidrug efflux pump subunit AcrB
MEGDLFSSFYSVPTLKISRGGVGGQVLPFFQKFGFIIVFTIFCSYLWATLFFVAACAVCGPEGDTGDIKALYAQARRLLTGHVKDVPAEEAIQVQGI